MYLKDPSLIWQNIRWSSSKAASRVRYAVRTLVPTMTPSSVIGFSLALIFSTQYVSGLLLSLIFVPEPAFVIVVREEVFQEFWWFIPTHSFHVVGVDLIFLFCYAHMFKKLFLQQFCYGDIDGWVTGTTAFATFHLVVFFGISLSSNHLAEITVTIGANIFWSLFGKTHEAFTLIFGNKHLSVDILASFMILHYSAALYIIVFILIHLLHIHEEWDSEVDLSTFQDLQGNWASWMFDVIEHEMNFSLVGLAFVHYSLISWPFYGICDRPVDYFFFEQWSYSEVEDINYFIVSPHWYFRPHMGLLTVCAKHYEGLFWLIVFYVMIMFQPYFAHLFDGLIFHDEFDLFPYPAVLSRFSLIFSALFLFSCFYVSSILPCGRFYYDISNGFSGSWAMKFSYQYIFVYLTILHHNLDPIDALIFKYRLHLKTKYKNKIKSISESETYEEILSVFKSDTI